MAIASHPGDRAPSAPRGGHRCSECGHHASGWFGRCPSCGSWGSAGAADRSPTAALEVVPLDSAPAGPSRYPCGIDEVDRVLGGGLVGGSVLLLAGEPGVGKSTLVLQIVDMLGRAGRSSVLITGEESVDQVRLRAARLQIGAGGLGVAAATSLDSVVDAMTRERPDLLVVDSIQTLRGETIQGAAGSVTQVRECAAELVRHAKHTGTAVLLTGHVTKDGSVAGPKVLEHVVDVVLTLEGQRGAALRMLRAAKNRFGSCEETGVFEMRATGLLPVPDPSSLLLEDRHPGVAGSIVFPALDGTRPVLVELQALVVRGAYAQPRRVAIGLDARRLSLLLGVLKQTTDIDPSTADVFASAAGGISVREPGADLPLCIALHSATKGLPLDPRVAAVGEVGLGGEIRRVAGLQRRLAECARLGFRTVLGPRDIAGVRAGVRVVGVSHVREALELLPVDVPEGRDAASRATLG